MTFLTISCVTWAGDVVEAGSEVHYVSSEDPQAETKCGGLEQAKQGEWPALHVQLVQCVLSFIGLVCFVRYSIVRYSMV